MVISFGWVSSWWPSIQDSNLKWPVASIFRTEYGWYEGDHKEHIWVRATPVLAQIELVHLTFSFYIWICLTNKLQFISVSIWKEKQFMLCNLFYYFYLSEMDTKFILFIQEEMNPSKAYIWVDLVCKPNNEIFN